ncbi:MAG: hypothetical protein HRT74_05540 [Flavobacteriales bacterium]|nr:hypothetical protein [Flavobacteriales bacterium]
MEVVKVSNKQDENSWLEMAHGIYSNDSNYIPHLKQDIQKVFDPESNKLFRNGKACRWYLKQEGKIVARIAAFVNDKYSKGMEQPTGGLGFFESVNDKDIAHHMLQVAVDWLKEQGMEAVDGPINFGEKDRFWGLLVDNFTSINSYAMNYNPPYYQELFESFGFQKYFEQYIYWRDLLVPAQDVFVEKSARLMDTGEYTIRNVVGIPWDQLAEDFRTVYNNAWGGHHGFKPMPEIQAKKIIQALKPVIDRDIIVFVEHKGKPIAFYVNIPELNQIFRHVNGNLNWWGKIKFLYHKLRKTSDIMVGLVFGVDRDYHGKGVEGAMIKWAGDNISTLGRYKTTTLTWIGDFNPKMIKIAENLGATKYRTLYTYRMLFDPNKPFKRAPVGG